jgi:chromate transporter
VTPAARPPLRQLVALFFRLVNFTFGGGDPAMAAIERELVDRRQWLTPEQYGLAYGLARVTPGTNVLAFSAATAWFLRGWPGALAAVVAGTIPCTILVAWLTYGYQALKTNPLALGAIAGTLASAVGMMFAAAWTLLRPELRRAAWLRALTLAGGAMALTVGLNLAPIYVLGLAAAVGFLWQGEDGE